MASDAGHRQLFLTLSTLSTVVGIFALTNPSMLLRGIIGFTVFDSPSVNQVMTLWGILEISVGAILCTISGSILRGDIRITVFTIFLMIMRWGLAPSSSSLPRELLICGILYFVFAIYGALSLKNSPEFAPASQRPGWIKRMFFWIISLENLYWAYVALFYPLDFFQSHGIDAYEQVPAFVELSSFIGFSYLTIGLFLWQSSSRVTGSILKGVGVIYLLGCSFIFTLYWKGGMSTVSFGNVATTLVQKFSVFFIAILMAFRTDSPIQA